MTIRAGSNFTNHGGQVVGVQELCEHPNFGKYGYDYDITVLRLNQSLDFGRSVNRILLQPLNEEVPTLTLGTLMGWGTLHQAGPMADRLQMVQIPKVPQVYCQRIYGYLNLTVTERMHCFGDYAGGKDSCQHDSGGSIVVNNRFAGIISWGLGCGVPFYPGVYVKLSHCEIRDHILNCLTKFANTP